MRIFLSGVLLCLAVAPAAGDSVYYEPNAVLIHITEEGRVVGDISAPRVILDEGAAFRGNVDMGDLEVPRRAPATSETRWLTFPKPEPSCYLSPRCRWMQD